MTTHTLGPGFHSSFSEPSFLRRRNKSGNEVRRHAVHERLRLGISETNVELEHFRPASVIINPA